MVTKDTVSTPMDQQPVNHQRSSRDRTRCSRTKTRPTGHRLAGTLAALSTAAAVHGQTILYVDDDAPGGNGRSWNEAFNDLQDALWLASYVQGVIEIRIADGIYTPDRGTGIREVSFQIDATMVGSVTSGTVGGIGLALKGAFAGITALDPNERDTNRFKSVLSGDLNGDDLPGFVNYEENSHRIMLVEGVNSGPVALDGLIFQGGNGEGLTGGALVLDRSDVVVSNCVFVNNRAENGGAVALYRGDPTFDRCFFGQNLALGHSGAIMACTRGLITNCIFSGNSAGTDGGAIRNDNDLRISGSVFYQNFAGGSGGAFSNYDNQPTISNSIFFENAPDQITPMTGSNVTVSHSNVQNGYPGTGNIDADPLFTDPLGPDGILGTPDDNFLPRFGSPVIDAGTNAAVFNPLGFDYAGQPRVVDDRFTPDTGLGTAPIVDMGAYEFQPPTCYADLDHSTGVGVLDLFDFLRFQDLFVMNDPLACQVDRSTGPNICDIFDFLAFQFEFATGCP